MVCSQSCHIYPHTRSHFYTFRFALVTDVESRPPDDDMVGNKIARRTAFIHRAAYLRHIFGVLWSYVSYTFRIRFDLLSVILLFGDFGRRRLKLQLQLMSYKDTDTTGEPVEHVTEPDKQIAHSALGDYGPFSVKYATKEFLSYGNKKFRI